MDGENNVFEASYRLLGRKERRKAATPIVSVLLTLFQFFSQSFSFFHSISFFIAIAASALLRHEILNSLPNEFSESLADKTTSLPCCLPKLREEN